MGKAAAADSDVPLRPQRRGQSCSSEGLAVFPGGGVATSTDRAWRDEKK